jgi:DNA-directed RNA polymerase specialized sigma24 family protein
VTSPVLYSSPLASDIERNDPALVPFLTAPDEPRQRRELEALLLCVRPVVSTVLKRFTRREIRPRAEDREDIESAVTLRFIRKLKNLAAGNGEPIERLEAYVAVLTQNEITDVLRERYPEMLRLRRRIRYLLAGDERLALWTAASGTVCGKASWEGREAAALAVTPGSASREMCNGRKPAEALMAIFERAGGPVLFDELIPLVARLWSIADSVCIDAAEIDPPDEQPSPLVEYESRRFLQALWAEVQALRPPQRAALLLNLRDIDGSNALALLTILEIATFDEIASALQITPQRLAALWSGLPIDDHAIAAMFGLKRQQVINLRRAARERLTRRLR